MASLHPVSVVVDHAALQDPVRARVHVEALVYRLGQAIFESGGEYNYRSDRRSVLKAGNSHHLAQHLATEAGVLWAERERPVLAASPVQEDVCPRSGEMDRAPVDGQGCAPSPGWATVPMRAGVLDVCTEPAEGPAEPQDTPFADAPPETVLLRMQVGLPVDPADVVRTLDAALHPPAALGAVLTAAQALLTALDAHEDAGDPNFGEAYASVHADAVYAAKAALREACARAQGAVKPA